MTERRRWPEPPADVIAAGLRALADELMDQFPQVEVVVPEHGRKPPPGSRALRGALPVEREALVDRSELRPGQRRDDDNPRDQ